VRLAEGGVDERRGKAVGEDVADVLRARVVAVEGGDELGVFATWGGDVALVGVVLGVFVWEDKRGGSSFRFWGYGTKKPSSRCFRLYEVTPMM